MKITNRAGLPDAIVRAVANDPYARGEADISVTQLVGPVMVRHLRGQFGGELVEDVADRIWALLGQAVHAIIDRACSPAELQEERLFGEFRGRVLSGQFDLFDGSLLADFKVTSVWSVKEGAKPEWTAQLNCLAHLLRLAGFEPAELQVIAVLRDWRKNEALKYGSDYPQQQVVKVPVELWEPVRAENYIVSRIVAHFEREPVVCSPEERWERPEAWAVKTKGKQRAHRLLPSLADAELWMDSNRGKGDHIEHRPGQSVRCEQYCDVRTRCVYGASLEVK